MLLYSSLLYHELAISSSDSPPQLYGNSISHHYLYHKEYLSLDLSEELLALDDTLLLNRYSSDERNHEVNTRLSP